jgi:CBS domain-containing protein
LHAEQLEIVGFLSHHAPFDTLSDEALSELARNIEVAYYRANTDILNFSDPVNDLFVIRKGSVETYRRTGELFNRLSEGDVFGQMGLMMNQRVRFPVKTLEDTLVYCIPVEQFRDYCERYETFADYFETGNNSLLHKAVAVQSDNNDLTTVKLKELMKRDLITQSTQASIRQVAEAMTEHNISSILLTDPNRQNVDSCGIDGIVTDRDLRERVLATGMDPETPVHKVMSDVSVTLDDNAYVFEAMQAMLRNNIHHLPILQRGKPIGILSLTDLVRHESQSSILMVRSIFQMNTLEELKAHAEKIPAVFVRMVREDANSHMIGSAISVIGRSFKQRLLEMAEEQFGPPPVPYCFLALGSMARDEQLMYTDQDNALVLADRFKESEHGEYFEKLAKFVSDGLNECGYTYCDGNVMATNPEWRKTRSGWKEHFAKWIDEANPQALLNGSIFFDLDGVWGRNQWADELRQFITHRTKNNRIFLASLARNALNRTPPLGFFKDFVMEKDGQHKNSINIKRRGTAPLTDVIRVHALAVGAISSNSFERLDDVIEAGILPGAKGTDLRDALEYISMVRIRHQANQIERNETPDNNIHPRHLSNFDRRNLKEAFQVLSNAQNFLKYRYNSNMSLKR